jgi:2,3-bisphosphoglycerate-independent phosphoglycerate mutase
LILLGDGMADWPLAEYGGRTPIEVAQTPSIDRIVQMGVLGQFCPIPEGLPAGSDVGNLSCFGYDPRACFGGRAPIEAANMGIPLAGNDVAFRCNLVTLENGSMRDFTSGHITSEEAAQIILSLRDMLGAEFPVTLFPGVSYRHIAVMRASLATPADTLAAIACTPPHDISGQAWEPHLPRGEASELVCAMMRRSQELLPDHPVNRQRVAEGKLPATSIWLWGQGKAPSMQTYADRFGLTGAVVSAVDLVRGIGVLAGLEVLQVPGATGWIDTNYEGKISAALEALARLDFAYVHVEATDETAHQGRADLKIQAIEDFDARIVAPALSYVEAHPDTRILVAPDHYTTIQTKTHAGGPALFALCGPGVHRNGYANYSEREAAQTGIVVRQGYRVTEAMLREAEVDFSRPEYA